MILNTIFTADVLIFLYLPIERLYKPYSSMLSVFFNVIFAVLITIIIIIVDTTDRLLCCSLQNLLNEFLTIFIYLFI